MVQVSGRETAEQRLEQRAHSTGVRSTRERVGSQCNPTMGYPARTNIEQSSSIYGCALSSLHSLRSSIYGCALSGLHSLRSSIYGCALSGLHSLRSSIYGCALSGLHSLRSFLNLNGVFRFGHWVGKGFAAEV